VLGGFGRWRSNGSEDVLEQAVEIACLGVDFQRW
jgi:hypothetical protein